MTRGRALLRRGLRSKGLWSGLLGMLLVGGLSVYALYAIFRKDTASLAFDQLIARIGVHMFLVSGLVYASDLALALLGWVWIMGTLSGVWAWGQHFRIYCITSVTRRLPGTMWYMLGRVMMYERLGVGRSLTIISGGLEFGATMLGGLLVALLAWPISLSGQSVSPAWFVAGLLLVALLLNPPTLRALVRRFSPRSGLLDLRYRHLCGWALLYALVWCVGGGILFVLASTIHPLTLAALPAMIGIWATSGLVSLLFSFVPFGLGVQELALSALLTPYLGGPEAIVTALLMRGVLTINEALWAVIAGLLWLGGALRPAADKQAVIQTPAGELARPDAECPEEVADATPVLPAK